MYLLPFTIALSLAAPAPSTKTDCHARPSDFLSGEQYWKDLPYGAEIPVKNRIFVQKSGKITWNHFPITIEELDYLLEQVRNSSSNPLTQFEWDARAPCISIELMRSMMRQRLGCARLRNCMEGADPREVYPPRHP